VSSKDYKFDLM